MHHENEAKDQLKEQQELDVAEDGVGMTLAIAAVPAVLALVVVAVADALLCGGSSGGRGSGGEGIASAELGHVRVFKRVANALQRQVKRSMKWSVSRPFQL